MFGLTPPQDLHRPVASDLAVGEGQDERLAGDDGKVLISGKLTENPAPWKILMKILVNSKYHQFLVDFF